MIRIVLGIIIFVFFGLMRFFLKKIEKNNPTPANMVQYRKCDYSFFILFDIFIIVLLTPVIILWKNGGMDRIIVTSLFSIIIVINIFVALKMAYWKIELKESSFTLRRLGRRMKEYKYSDIEIRTSNYGKVRLYYDQHKIFSLPYYVDN